MKKNLKAITVLIFITTIFSCNMDVKEKTTSISGVVKYENAIDHEGINVTLVSTDGLMAVDTSSDRVMDSSSRAIEDFVVTDKNGNYIFKNVREGVYTIYASSNFSKGKAIENNIVVKATSPVTVNELKLTATGSIMGKVSIDDSFENAYAIDVLILGTPFSATTNEFGEYEIFDIPAKSNYSICFRKNGYTYILDKSVNVEPNKSVNVEANISSQEWKDYVFTWLGEKSEAPTNPEKNQAYFNTKDGCSYIWNGEKWDLLSRAGKDGADGKDGVDGKDGIDGKDGADGEDGIDGKDGADGEDGIDGKDGADGKDGVDGKDGADGKDANDFYILSCEPTEKGIKFSGDLLNNMANDAVNTYCEILITDLENNVRMRRTIFSKSAWDLEGWEIIYPLVEKDKEYKFEVYIGHQLTKICTKEFTVKSIGGLGEYKVENADDYEIILDENKVLSRTKQQFTDNPKVPVIRYGTEYILCSNDSDDSSVYDGKLLYSTKFWEDTTEQKFDIKEGVDWMSYENFQSKLKGRMLGISGRTVMTVAGFTYDGTTHFELNDRKEFFFNWDDENTTKLFVMYGIPKYRITYENILGVEKYYILNNSDGTASFVEEGTENAIEVYGMFMEYDQQIEVPLFVPEVPNEVQDSDCYIFTGNWKSYVALEGNDTLNCSLPCDVYTITTEPVEDLIDGCPFVFFTPEFIQTKARADFYAEDTTTLIESIYCTKNFYGDMYVTFPAIPEKTGFVGYWTDSSDSKFYPGEKSIILGTSKDFVLVYEEL